jgi:uncharacterized membrane protein
LSDSSTSPAAPRGIPRWVKVVLVLSLAANLLVAGMMLGAVMGRDRHFDRGETRTGMPREFVRTPFLAALDPDDRRAVGRALMRDAGPLRENRAELRERFERLLAALRAEPFDRAAVEALLEEQRLAGARRLEIAEVVLLDHLEALPPEGRRDYADRLDRSLRRGP